MTDTRLAMTLQAVMEFELDVRAYWQSLPAENLAERDAAQIATRQAIALRKPLETWLATRSLRAALATRVS